MHEIMSQQLINGKQQFIDGNGNPLAGGSVAFYAPGTLNPVNTWQDQGLTTLNTNPVILDASGMATIWGSLDTQYRQVVTNALGVQLWDQVVGTVGNVIAQSVQSGSYNSAADTGSINAYAMTLSPAPTKLTPGMMVTLLNVKATNTGASVLSVNGGGAIPITEPGGAALRANEITAAASASLIMNSAGTAWVLVSNTATSMRGSSTMAASGYRTLPAFPGDPLQLMMQWAAMPSISAGASATVTLPMTFPSAVMSVAGLPVGSSQGVLEILSFTNYSITFGEGSGTHAITSGTYIAIGY